MDEIIAMKIEERQAPFQPAFVQPERFEVLVPAENTEIFDAKGNQVSGFRKKTVSLPDLDRREEFHQAELAKIQAERTAINNIK